MDPGRCNVLLALVCAASSSEWSYLLAPTILSTSDVESPATLFRLCIATISIYSTRAWVVADASALQSGPWGAAFGTVVTRCFQIVYQIALAQPHLVLPTNGESTWSASVGDKRKGLEISEQWSVITLAREVTWAYFVRQLVQTLRFARCPQQILIASQLLVMATAETYNDHSELLVIQPVSAHRPRTFDGYILHTLEFCLRRIWPSPKHIATQHQQPETLCLNSISDAVSITKHLCQVKSCIFRHYQLCSRKFDIESDPTDT